MMRLPTVFLLAVLITAPVPYAAPAHAVQDQPELPRTPAAAAPDAQERERQPAPAPAPQPSQERTPQGERGRTPAPEPPQARRPMPTRNVKVDVTITDQAGSGAPTKKQVQLVVADGQSAGVRTRAGVVRPGMAPFLPLNVDAEATVTPDHRILLKLGFEYHALPVDENAVGSGPAASSSVSENLTVLLTPGMPLVVSRSADATSDRNVTVEVKAEILK